MFIDDGNKSTLIVDHFMGGVSVVMSVLSRDVSDIIYPLKRIYSI
jgi:hypothetical protein